MISRRTELVPQSTAATVRAAPSGQTHDRPHYPPHPLRGCVPVTSKQSEAQRFVSQEDAAALANILNLGKVGAHNALQDFAQTTRRPDQLHLLVIMQRDSGASHYAHGRPKNEGLMLVAGIALGDGLDAAVKENT